ncbi:MAG: hypothetical protein WBF33_27110 [Candidatus Nitrosopolaris sp.]
MSFNNLQVCTERVMIENSYKDAKQIGYRFRKSEAALIHTHLVFLAHILLLSYRITKAVPSMGFVITWVRKKTRQGFIHENANTRLIKE